MQVSGRGSEVSTIADLVRPGRPVAVLGEAGIGVTTTLVAAAAALDAPVARTGGLRSLVDRPLVPLSRLAGADLTRVKGDPAAHVAELLAGHVVVVDDLQWADDASLAALPGLAASVPVLVGLRLGDPRTERAVQTVRAAGGVVVRLGPLDDAACRAIAAEHAPEADDAQVATAIAAAGGNPLALIHLLTTGSVSASLSTALAAVVDSLTPAARSAMALTDLHGGPVDPALVASTLDELVDQALVVVDADGVRARHPSVGAAATASLDDAERRRLHRRLADASSDDATAARHLAAAGAPEEAVARARAAMAGASPVERARLLALAADCTPGPERTSLLVQAAAAALEADRVRHARSLAEAAATGGTTDPALWPVLAEAAARDGDVAVALDAAARVATTDGTDRSRALAATAWIHAWPLWEAATALPAATAAMTTKPVAPLAGRSLALARVVAADPAWAVDGAEPDAPTQAWGRLLFDTDPTGDAPAAVGDEITAALVELHRDGDCDGSAARLQAVLPRLDRPWQQALVAAHLAVALADSGRTSAATDLARRHLDDAPGVTATALWWAIAEAELAASRLTKARGVLDELHDAPPSPPLALALLAIRWAVELAPEPVDLEVPVVECPWPGLRGVALELAALDIPRADGDERAAAFHRAAEAWVGLARRAELRCRWAVADARADDPGDRDRQQQLVADLVALDAEAGRLGQRPIRARVRATLRRLGIRPKQHRGAGRGQLSAREVEVLELVRLGFTSGEAAQALGVAPSTIDTQVESAMRKLDARTRVHAAALAAELTS